MRKPPKTIPQINTPPTPLQKGKRKRKKIIHHHPKKQLLEKKCLIKIIIIIIKLNPPCLSLKKRPILPFPCHPMNKNPLQPPTQNQHL
jgi:hypothetical protein